MTSESETDNLFFYVNRINGNDVTTQSQRVDTDSRKVANTRKTYKRESVRKKDKKKTRVE